MFSNILLLLNVFNFILIQKKLKERGKHRMQPNAKAIVELDGNELIILNRLLIKSSKIASENGKWQESQQFIILADKLADAKEEFHRGHYAVMSEKYNLKNDKKA